MEKREIILTRGIQASGKSTYAEHWAKEKPTERIRINWDSLRNMFGQYWVEEREKLNIIKEMTDAFFKSSMENGLNIIMDSIKLSIVTNHFFLIFYYISILHFDMFLSYTLVSPIYLFVPILVHNVF